MEKTRKKVQGCFIDLVDKYEALDFINENIKMNNSLQIITINPEMIIKASHDKSIKEIINNADLILPDGVGIKIALKLKGIKQEQIRGVEFSYKILEMAQEKGYKVGFLGAKDEVIKLMSEKIKEKMPDLNIVYIRNGYFENDREIIEEIKNANPNIMLTALGFPKQEIMNSKLKELLPDCVTIGVGGSFDVWAGVVSEAPAIWRKLGLEWLYRTIKQPERFKRIFPTLPIFMFRSIIEVIGLLDGKK